MVITDYSIPNTRVLRYYKYERYAIYGLVIFFYSYMRDVISITVDESMNKKTCHFSTIKIGNVLIF